MADIADNANRISDLYLKTSLQNAQAKPQPFSGFCLSCDEPVVERRYCNRECRDDHERSLRRP